MPMQNSATSSPRVTSPTESATVLPCSRDISSASGCMSRLSSSTNFISTRARRWGLVAAQPGCASVALFTAASRSAEEAKATCASTSPVAGLKTSPWRVPSPATARPSMKWVILRMAKSLERSRV